MAGELLLYSCYPKSRSNNFESQPKSCNFDLPVAIKMKARRDKNCRPGTSSHDPIYIALRIYTYYCCYYLYIYIYICTCVHHHKFAIDWISYPAQTPIYCHIVLFGNQPKCLPAIRQFSSKIRHPLKFAI